MVLGMLPMTALAAGTELTVSTSSSGYTQVNIIEQSVGSGKLQYFQVYLQSTYGKVSVDSATQDGMTIDVVLAEGTDPSAALQVGFNGTGLGFPQTQSGNKCTLENGSGAMTCTYTSAGNSVTYTINFTTAGNGEGEGEGEDPLATLSFTTDLSEEEVKCTVGDTVEALVVAAEQSKGESVSYQWYSNSTNSTEGATAIAEATSASYTPVTNDAGTTYYYVVATCGELTATSKAAKITVEKAEEEEIVLAATCNNYAVSFTVGGATVKSASTTPNGNNGTLELVVTDVTGSTVNVTAAFSKYNVPMVRFSSGFTSNVNVSAGSGTKSETVLACQPNGQPMGNLGTWTINVTVSDYEAPATLGFTTNLNEDTVTYTVGDTVEALVVAAEQSKGESVSYQWYSNSTNSTEGATAIADATSASYTPDTTAAGTTYYYAVATCGDLSATSEIAAVVVEEAKEIILSATSEYYTITFEVEGATVVSAQPTVSGYGGTLQLDVKDVTTADNKIKVTPTVTGGSYDTDVYYVTLNLSSGSGENSFEIWDVAAGFPTNKVGEWKIKAVVVDETNPATVSFTKDLSEDEVKYVVGKTASALTVKAVQSRGEAVSYQWYKNSSKSTEGAAAIEGANSASYTPDTAAVGTTYYYAVATSGELTVTSKIAMITVEAPAALTITTDLNEDEVKYTVGDSAEALTVVAEQSKGEAVSYQW